MDQKYYNISYAESPFGTLQQYMARTYGWMFAGLLATFAVAIGVITSGLFVTLYNSGLTMVLCIAEIILVAVLSMRVERLQPSTATALFFGYALLNGVNLSVLFVIYDLTTLVLAFLVGTVYFGVMALYGLRTERDLSGWGPNLVSGLFALLITGAVGMLFGAITGIGFGLFDFLLCAVSLVIFMLFTAYDTQKIKFYYSYFGGDAGMLHKYSIMGALSLYLDYINIFLYVLRILARSRNNN